MITYSDEDCDIICSLKYNEAYILLLLEKSKYILINNEFRKFYNTTTQQDIVFITFLSRYYNTLDTETVNLCITNKYYDIITNKTRDDLSIKNFKFLIFNTTKDDSFINYKCYKKFCKIVDESKYYCDYCKKILI